MRLIELFESSPLPKLELSPSQEKREEIARLLDSHFNLTGKYSISDNLVVDVNGSVKLKTRTNRLPIKFGKVSGNFDCGKRGLATLEGCPTYVGRSFWCFDNKLTSLEGCPSYVGHDFQTWQNQLTSLQGSPTKIGGLFDCHDNQITSLEGGPTSVCAGPGLKDPKASSYYECGDNPLTSLNGLPVDLNGGSFRLSFLPNLSLIKILFIKNVHSLSFFNKDDEDAIRTGIGIANIMNKYIGKGRGGALQCAAELTKAGYKGNARL